MTYETPCNPIPAADVEGFNFFRERDGAIIARCTRCKIGLTVTDENAERVRYAMTIHLDAVHGL